MALTPPSSHASSGSSGLPPLDRIMTVSSFEFSCSALFQLDAGNAAMVWPAANDPIALPFRIASDLTVRQLGWLNGAGPLTDSVDVGIYNASLARQVSSGSVARAGTSVWQWADVADTVLTAGIYYLAASASAVAAAQQLWHAVADVDLVAFSGALDSATDAFPLPATLVVAAAATFTRLPYLAIAGRVPF